ncbi:MAG TPA: hypothetical protein ENI48_01150 [Thioploca sp.]|nr:hypothetical protein [Thioploca sp.]
MTRIIELVMYQGTGSVGFSLLSLLDNGFSRWRWVVSKLPLYCTSTNGWYEDFRSPALDTVINPFFVMSHAAEHAQP